MSPLRAGRWVMLGLLLAAIGLLGGGGWLIWTLDQAQRDTARHLAESQASLANAQAALSTSEDAREKLAKDYETLKQRWTKSDEDLKDARRASDGLAVELAKLSSERADLQRQLEQMTKQRDAFEGQAEGLQESVNTQRTSQQRLEAEVANARALALSLNEARQLAEAWALRRAEDDRLRQQLAALSHEYELLAQLTPASRSAHRSTHATSGLASIGAQPSRRPPNESATPSRHESAALYRNLGASYLATEQYTQAAEALEHSLTLEDNPGVHGTLAFLYSRLLSNAGKAARHQAASHNELLAPLPNTAQPQGLPRSSWRLVWRWLTE